MKKMNVKRVMTILLAVLLLTESLSFIKPMKAEAHLYGHLETIGTWEVYPGASQAEIIAEQMAWMHHFILDGYGWLEMLMWPDYFEEMYPERSEWFQWVVAYCLLEENQETSRDDMQPKTTWKKDLLQWAKEHGYWEEDYVAPYETWDLNCLRDTYYLQTRGKTSPAYPYMYDYGPTDFSITDYEIITYDIAATGIFEIDYHPSTIKYIDRPDFVYTERYTNPTISWPLKAVHEYPVYRDKNGEFRGIGYTDEWANKMERTCNTPIRFELVDAEQWHFMSYTQDEFQIDSFILALSRVGRTGEHALKLTTGWVFEEEAPDYTLEIMAEILPAEAFTGTRYESWYKEWLKQYKGTAGNWQMINEINNLYEERYGEWLAENKPGISLYSGQPTATPTVTPKISVTNTPTPTIKPTETVTPNPEVTKAPTATPEVPSVTPEGPTSAPTGAPTNAPTPTTAEITNTPIPTKSGATPTLVPSNAVTPTQGEENKSGGKTKDNSNTVPFLIGGAIVLVIAIVTIFIVKKKKHR